MQTNIIFGGGEGGVASGRLVGGGVAGGKLARGRGWWAEG